MNNTHYALINEDNNVVAVIRANSEYKDRLKLAIEDETGDEVSRLYVEETETNNFKVHAKMVGDGLKYSATLLPTWEY
jgi:hypothetical protein